MQSQALTTAGSINQIQILRVVCALSSENALAKALQTKLYPIGKQNPYAVDNRSCDALASHFYADNQPNLARKSSIA